MRKSTRLKLTLAVGLLAAVFVGTASAHTSGLTAAAVCNTQTGLYTVTWTVGPTTDQNLSPKVFASNRAVIAVGSPLGVSTDFVESIPGSTTTVSATITVRWSDNFKDERSATLTLSGTCSKPTPPSNPKCPEGYTPAGTSDGVLLCTKETIKTVTNTVTNTVTVWGKPTCPTGSTQTAAGDGYVVCQLPPVVTPPPPPVTVTKIVKVKVYVNKWHTRWRTKIVKVKWCPVPKPPVCKTTAHSGCGKG